MLKPKSFIFLTKERIASFCLLLSLDTSELMDVVSVLGDINVNIKSEDMKLINNLIPKFYAEFQDSSKGEMKLITSPGELSWNSA